MPQIRPIHLLKYIPVLAAAASGAYAQKPTLANSAPFALSARELLDEAAGGPSSVATDTIILLDHDAFVFDADGRKTETTHLVYRVVTAKGVEGAASIERDWEPWHQKRPVVRARVIASDGAVHELDPKTVTEAPARADQGNTFSDARVVRCPLPAVAAGSVVEEEIVTGETAPWFSAGVATRVPMTGPVPIRLMRVTVEYPEKLALQYKTYLLPDADTTKQTNGGTVTLRFEASSPEPFQDMQPMLPFDVPRWPHVIFSTGGSWNAVARAYNAIVEKQIEGAPVADLVKQSAAGKTGRRDIASALLRTIHAQVRYTGVEFGEAAIVPAKPADVLGRKYGDCKDKAALLVSMLRAAGIPAYVALLSNGLDMDVDPAFPGLGLFNHAIVYSPGAQASDDLWIDATAEYLDFGAVPASDQGRLALIVREDATELKRIPESPSSSDHVSETREFFLPDFGKARVVATIEAGGESGESYREGFGSADTDQVRKGLTAYMQRNYLSESTVRIDHSAGSDFSKPFHLRLEVADSNLGSVSEAEAGVVIPLVSLLERMPGYFLQEEPKPAPDSKPKPKRTEDFVLPESFVTEWHYRIELPAGFQIKKVPENKKLELGPALLTSEYKEDKNVVTATLKFDTVKRRYTANEAAQFRKAALEFAKQPVALLYFETVGQNRLESGRIAEAIVWSESMVKQFPKRALYHVQASRAYLAAAATRLVARPKSPPESTSIISSSGAISVSSGCTIPSGASSPAASIPPGPKPPSAKPWLSTRRIRRPCSTLRNCLSTTKTDAATSRSTV
jgi:transglutaminase-like putative cysteine protease